MGYDVETYEQHDSVDENGEVTHTVRHNIQYKHTKPADPEPNYIKIYLDHVINFYDLPNKSSDVLFQMLRRSYSALWASDKYTQEEMKDNNIGMIYMNSEYKRRICKELDISKSTFERHIKALCDANILHRTARATYMVNPNIIARGDWGGIRKLRATFDYIARTVVDVDIM